MATAKKILTVGDALTLLENRSPSGTAEKWDNVGLLVGDPKWKTSGAVVAIDLTQEAIDMAVKKGYRLIINHHPCIFPKSKGLSSVTSNGPSALIYQALRAGIAVAASHTNFDQCGLEVIQAISEGLGVQPKGRLLDLNESAFLKLVVFVPQTHLEQVREALGGAGAGHIGNYDLCSFSAQGQGTFRGLDGSNPFLGKAGILEKVQEYRLETLIPRGLKKQILQALRSSHPYEEIAYDLYPVENPPGLNFSNGLTAGLGYGFWGDFLKPKTFSEMSRSVKRLFELDGFWITNPAPKRIKRIGFVAGKGASFVNSALASGCDLFITGEAGYHTAREGALRGMAVMEIGHRESEKFFVSTVRDWLSVQGFSSVAVHVQTQRVMSQ